MGIWPNLTAAVPQWKALVEAVVTRAGYELVEAELRGAEAGRVLRVYVDRPGGVGLEDCERVSRELSAELDAEEAAGREVIGGAYTLEVSSPGWDRPLAREADFRRFAGERVRVAARQAQDGRRHFVGALRGSGSDGVHVELETGGEVVIAWANLQSARLAPLPPAPRAKPGGPARKRRG